MRFTPTEERIYGRLVDGLLHYRPELQLLLGDDLSETALDFHLSRLRTKLRTVGECVHYDGNGYRLTRFVQS